MKIENNSRQKVRYDSLKCGDVFESLEFIYMKTYEDSDSKINAINLINNDLSSFTYSDMVVKLKAKLIIE